MICPCFEWCIQCVQCGSFLAVRALLAMVEERCLKHNIGQHCSQARTYQSDNAQTINLLGLAGELEALQGVMGTGDQTEVLGRLVSRVATLEAAAGEAEAQRRSLHNQLVELRGNVSLVPLQTCHIQNCVCLVDA